MKKIKGLLLFGILTLLGIGSSFASTSIGSSIDYYSENGGLTSYSFAYRATSQSTYGGFIYYNGNLLSNVVNYSPFYQKGGQPVSFNLSDYSLLSGIPRDYNLTWNNSTSSIYFDSTSNKLALWLYYDYYGTQVSWLFPLSNGFSSLNASNLIAGNGYYVRVFADSSCLNTGTIISGSCSPNYVQVFTNSQYTYSSDGTYIDTQYNDVNYIKGAIAPGVYKGYSFGFVSGSGWQNGVIDTTNGDFFDFRYIDFNGNEIDSYKGVYLIRLDSSYSVDSSNYNVLALGITGSVEDFSLTYSIYNCPSNSSSISNCSFAFGGLTNYTGLNSSSLNINTDFGKFIYLLTSPSSTRKVSTSYNGNTINFFGDYYINGPYDFHYSYNYNLTLSTVSDLDIIGPIPDGGDGNDVPFVFDYNSLIINNMVICYITSGDVCPYDNFSMSGFENSFPVVNRLWDGVNGQLLMDSAKPYLIELCLNSDTINYAFCSQLDIYSGAFILFDYSNGILTYNILGDSFAVDVAISNSGQLGSVGCYGAYCTNINVGATEYIINQDSGYYTGFFLSTGYYEDFLSLNKTGFFMKCPYSYDNQNVVIGKNLLNKLGGFDLFVPINCMIAGFNAGKSFTMIDWAGFKELGPIMKFTDDYDGNHKILFTFIDVLLSVAIIVILMKLYHLFK